MPVNLQPAAATLEFRRPVPLPHFLQFGKERPDMRKRLQDALNFFAKADDGNGSGLVAVETHDLALPVNVLGGQARHIRLCAAQVPAKLVKRPALRVQFLFDDGLVFLQGDCPLLFEPDLRPLLLGKNRPGQPTHVEGKIVKPAQEHVRRHRTGLKHFQKLHGVGFENRQVADEVKRLVLHRPLATDQRRPGLGSGHLVHWRLPGALGNFRVGRGQVGPGDMQIEDGLPVGLVFGMQKGEGLGFVLRAETGLLAGGRVLAVVNSRSPEHDEFLFHI